jgi:hypothetical protein
MSAIGICALAVGLGAGYIYGKRHHNVIIVEEDSGQMELDFDSEEEEEYVRPAPVTPIFEHIPDRIIEAESAEEEDPEPPEEEVPEVHNIFVKTDDPDWDYEFEVNSRSSELPYVIHVDEFVNDEMGLPQSSLTFYEGDEVLTDEQDNPIYNHRDIVGDLKFGHGSNDPNVVYIRNEKLNAEYEVLLYDGHFAHEVLGLHAAEEIEDEIKHSQASYRFRQDD